MPVRAESFHLALKGYLDCYFKLAGIWERSDFSSSLHCGDVSSKVVFWTGGG